MWNQQPVRNLLSNPTIETATATNVVIRTNLAYSPRQTNTNLGGYGTQTVTTVTGLTGAPEGITTGVRVTYGAGASNAGTIFLQVPDISSQYTVSAWVYNEGATSESIGLALKGASSGGTQVVPQGVWTQLSWTMTTPGSLGSGNDFGARIGNTAAAGSFLVTGVLIEKAVGFVGAWFDGASATSGDWNHAWLGTANASSSVRRGILPANIGVSGSAGIVQSGEWSSSAGKSMRIIHTPSSTIAEAGLADIALVKPGVTYTVIGKLRLDKVAASSHSRSRRFNFYWSTNGGANYTEANGPQAPNAIGVYDLRYTFTVPADSTNTLLRAGAHSWGTAGIYQADAWWDDIMLVEGEYTGDYVDGTKPFSKWDGSANASTSVGYPQWLYQLAGVPDYDVSAVGTYTLPGGYGDQEPRTIYTVSGNTLDITDGSFRPIVLYGESALSDTLPNTYITMRVGLSSGTGNTMVARRTGGSGIARSPHPIGNAVTCWGITSDGKMFSAINNGAEAADTVVMTLPHQKIQILAASDAAYHVRTIIYRGRHDATTRTAISRYLGNKYGANVA